MHCNEYGAGWVLCAWSSSCTTPLAHLSASPCVITTRWRFASRVQLNRNEVHSSAPWNEMRMISTVKSFMNVAANIVCFRGIYLSPASGVRSTSNCVQDTTKLLHCYQWTLTKRFGQWIKCCYKISTCHGSDANFSIYVRHRKIQLRPVYSHPSYKPAFSFTSAGKMSCAKYSDGCLMRSVQVKRRKPRFCHLPRWENEYTITLIFCDANECCVKSSDSKTTYWANLTVADLRNIWQV